MQDEKILDLYFARNEEAIRESETKYGGYCRKVAGNILAADEDVEEAVNDTWLHAWNAIPPQRPTVLRLFFAKIARNCAYNIHRAQAAQKRCSGELVLALEELGECVSPGGDPAQAVDAKALAASIRSFLESIPLRERRIFVLRYFFVENTASIASQCGLSQNNVLQILSRTRRKLKSYLVQEGYEL